MHTSEGCHWEKKRKGIGCPGGGLTDRRGLPDVGGGPELQSSAKTAFIPNC